MNTGNLIIQESTVKLGASNVLTDSTSINVGNNACVAGATFDLNGFYEHGDFRLTSGITTPGTAGLTTRSSTRVASACSLWVPR